MGGVPKRGGACESLRLSPCVLVQPDGWARGEREGYGGPCDVTSLSLNDGVLEPSRRLSKPLLKRIPRRPEEHQGALGSNSSARSDARYDENASFGWSGSRGE